MATGLLAIAESVTVSFMWEDDNGAPLTSLSPAPTLAVTNPAGTVTTPALTQRGSTAFFDYTFTPDTVGTWVLQARCTDTDCATEYTEPVALWVTADSITEIQAKTDLLHFTGALGSEKVNSLDDHLDDEIAAIQASLAAITSGSVTVTSPVNAMTSDLEIIRGDDYTVTSGRTLPSWTSASWTPYDLSTATAIQFRARTKYSATVFTKSMHPAISDTLVRLELTDAETAAFAVGRDAYDFDIQATLFTGDIVTLVQGKMSVVADVT